MAFTYRDIGHAFHENIRRIFGVGYISRNVAERNGTERNGVERNGAERNGTKVAELLRYKPRNYLQIILGDN